MALKSKSGHHACSLLLECWSRRHPQGALGYIDCLPVLCWVLRSSHSAMSDSLQPHGLQLARLLRQFSIAAQISSSWQHAVIIIWFLRSGVQPRLSYSSASQSQKLSVGAVFLSPGSTGKGPISKLMWWQNSVLCGLAGQRVSVSWRLLARGCCCLVAHSCLTLCDPMDCGPPNSSVHGILQRRILEWVAVSFCYGIGRVKEDSLCGPQFLVRTQRIKLPPIFLFMWASPQNKSLNIAACFMKASKGESLQARQTKFYAI